MMDDVGVLPDVQESTDWILVLAGLQVQINEFVSNSVPLLDRSRVTRA